MTKDALNERRQALEDEFFHRVDEKLLTSAVVDLAKNPELEGSLARSTTELRRIPAWAGRFSSIADCDQACRRAADRQRCFGLKVGK